MSPASPGPSVLWASALTAAILGGLASWANGEKFYTYYQPSRKALADTRNFQALNREQAVADGRNTAIAYGFLGAALGVMLGLAGGLAQRSVSRGLIAAIAGGLVGGAASVGLSFLLMPVFRQNLEPEMPTLLLPLLVHGAIWMAAGAGGGLGFGLGLGGFSTTMRTVLGGLVGAMIGTTLFEVVVAVCFAMLRFDDLIGPTPLTRFLAYACVALSVGVGCATMASLKTSQPNSSSSATTKGLDS
jgi:hypothetical protein